MMVNFTVSVENAWKQHHVRLQTGDHQHALTIAPKASGYGSSVNGGEALLLALATCYCNDIYREAEGQGIRVTGVTINVHGAFDGMPGHPITDIVYDVAVEADAPPDVIETLVRSTDAVAEIHNTLRQGAAVTLQDIKTVSRKAGE